MTDKEAIDETNYNLELRKLADKMKISNYSKAEIMTVKFKILKKV